MAGATGRQTTELSRRLLGKGSKHTFIQGVRLLRLLLRRASGKHLSRNQLYQFMRVRPDLTLGYPREDIKAVEADPFNDERFLLTVTFLGLYGSSSPLPTFYTEDLLTEQSDGESVARDFIDIVNASLYPLFYRSWSKHRLLFNVDEEVDPSLIEKLHCLLGLGDQSFRSKVDDSFGLLRYIGLTTQSTRSAEGLRALLADNLDEPSFEIEQCIARMAQIPVDQRCYVGVSGCTLGENAYLGSEVSDRNGKFRVRLGPLDPGPFHRFLPDRTKFAKMKQLINFYLDQPLDWDVAIRVDSQLVMPARLGKADWSQLGWDTWLFSFGEDPEVTEVTLKPN